MRCEDFMTTPPAILGPDDTALDAAQAMRELDVGFIPVCGADRRVLGTVTDRDLVLRIIADDRGHDVPLSDVMSAPHVVCRPDDDIRLAAELMRESMQGRILCIDDAGRLVGVISLMDLARFDAEATSTATRIFSDLGGGFGGAG